MKKAYAKNSRFESSYLIKAWCPFFKVANAVSHLGNELFAYRIFIVKSN